MTLPTLPRVLNKREQKITPKITAWLLANCPHNMAIEIKVPRGDANTIARNAVKPHQIRALIEATQAKGIIVKISDASRVRQPFDAFMLSNARAYVIAYFPHAKIALAIPVREWNGATVNSHCEFSFIP